MNAKRYLLETATLVAAAVLCALVSNALAGRERKLALVGSYPNALKVPKQETEKTRTTGDSFASLSAAPATSSPAGSEAAAPSEVSSKVNGALASAPTPRASTGGTEGKGKLPLEEKRPGPAAKSTPKATALPTASEAKNEILRRFPPHPDKPYIEISGDDVAWLHGHAALVLDARRTKDYEAGHIAGAKSVPVWESDVDERIVALLNEGRNMASPVVLYCSGGDCEDSHMLAQKLFGAGFSNLLVYKDGWPDWEKRHGPGATGLEK